MKIFGLIATLILSFSSFGQKSYYFSEPVFSTTGKMNSIPEKLHGNYKGDKPGWSIEINEKGIYAVSTTVSSISNETLRESSKYKVKDDFLFGVLENDSVPCVFENDRYYFGIRNKDLLIGTGSLNVLTKDKTDNTYYLNVSENGYYTPMKLVFSRKMLEIFYFDYDYETSIFDSVKNQKTIKTKFHDLVILSPTNDETNDLIFKNVFGLPRTLTLSK